MDEKIINILIYTAFMLGFLILLPELVSAIRRFRDRR